MAKLNSAEYQRSLLGLIQRLVLAHSIEQSIDIEDAKVLVASLLTETIMPSLVSAETKVSSFESTVSIIDAELEYMRKTVKLEFNTDYIRGVLLRIKQSLEGV